MAHKVEDLRNLAILGHGSAGKTTLVDHILVKTGAVNANPSVDNGTSICDFDEVEKHRRYSIESTVTHFDHGGKRFNLIDCPGYPELIGQTIGALLAVETALIAIDASAGIKVNTRRCWDEAGKAGVGRVIVVTKMDNDHADFPSLYESMKEVFGNGCIPINVPCGSGSEFAGVISTLKLPDDTTGAVVDPADINELLVESLVEADEALMEKYFEGEIPSSEQLAVLMAQSILSGAITPILCVSAAKDKGMEELLDFLASSAIPPTAIERAGKYNGETVSLAPDPSGPLAAMVFKTRIDPFVQKLCFLRIFSGTLKKDTTITTSSSRKGIKIAHPLEVQANEIHAIDSAGPGDIVAVAKIDELHTGSSLGDFELPKPVFPRPMVGLAVTPKSRGDETKLSGALHKITEEDSTVLIDHDPETKEMVLNGMSELHLNLIQERLKRRDKVEIDTKEPKVPYRETIQANAEGSYRHKKQSGGSGQFGEVHMRMFPFPEGATIDEFATKERFPHLKHAHFHEQNNFLWVDSVVGATIPGNFMPAVEKGCLERIKQGVIAGYPVRNVCVEIFFGKDHPVDSNETAFRIASSRCFMEVFKQARPTLLEPVVNMHITVPAEHVGDVSSDLSGRRGQMVGMTSAGGGMTTVEAKTPLSEVSTYARTLSSMTGGQGSYSLEFSHYDMVPPNVQQEVLSKSKVQEERDD